MSCKNAKLVDENGEPLEVSYLTYTGIMRCSNCGESFHKESDAIIRVCEFLRILLGS